MNFELTDEQKRRKAEYDAFFEELMKEAPPEIRRGGLEASFRTEEAYRFFRKSQKMLGQKRWLTMAWPRKYGGLAASNIEQLLFTMSAEEHDAPGVEAIGVNIFAPAVLAFSTEEQKARWLPPIARGEVIYCQCWSEPDAGSDLANLSTTAIRQGDEYVVNGQKIWTTAAHHADHIYLLARTDPETTRSRGLSAFQLDMDTPGIEVRPLYYMNRAHFFNEVFFKDVRVPAENRIGAEGQGWAVTFASMSTERSGFFLYSQCQKALNRIIDHVRHTQRNGGPLSKDPVIRQKIARLYAKLQGGMMLGYRIATILDEQGVRALPISLPSESKVFGTDLQYELFSLASEAMGLYGTVEDADHSPLPGMLEAYQFTAAFAVAMGSNEIQRNIIAWDGLKQPRCKMLPPDPARRR